MNGALFIEGESAEAREKRLLAHAAANPLRAEWCEHGDCEDDGAGLRPDGSCRCGLFKHHVHGICGAVIQVG